jgi:hypothetical protein
MSLRWILLGVLMAVVSATASAMGQDQPEPGVKKVPALSPQAWTLADARAQLALHPTDVYLQYVALRLASGGDQWNAVTSQIETATGRVGRGPERRVDLFDLFTGASAVQESLQLDTMRAPRNATPQASQDGGGQVEVNSLQGPQVRSHPWREMLARQKAQGKQPKVAGLAMVVPEDQFFITFHSLEKLLQLTEAGDLWGDHLFSHAAQTAQTQKTAQHLKEQLAIRTDPLSRPFYDMVVEEIAITGSDLYFREGTDVTLLFAAKQPEVLKVRMDGFLAEAQKAHPDAVRREGTVLGVDYVELATPDRTVHVFSAWPKPALHVRSNSKAALQRVLETIAGTRADGHPAVPPLGASDEFQYIRTLMPVGAKEEDGLVYLSDAFIRRIVGPQVKLTEYRRMLCYNHLRMIGSAAMLYRTQFGRRPGSLADLADSGCAPALFGERNLRCPCDGTYSLAADGTAGVCSHHGHARQLVPCCEIPLTAVTQAEARDYKAFLTAYNSYWRTFFDPIAIRLQVGPRQYRAETIILPLIDNSIYTALAETLGGEPEGLEPLPVPKRNIFTTAARVDKRKVLYWKGLDPKNLLPYEMRRFGESVTESDVRHFLNRGLGNQISLNVYDAEPTFDFDPSQVLGDALRPTGSGPGNMANEMWFISFLIASLNSPVYLAAPVEEPQIVDAFLDKLSAALAAMARTPQQNFWFALEHDFYRAPVEKDCKIQCYSLRFGPIKWRLFFARIGRGFYVASKEFILDDLIVMEKQQAKAVAEGKPADAGPRAHAMLRVRPKNWKAVLSDYELGWSESGRHACLNNLGPLSSTARAATASAKGSATMESVLREAETLQAVHFFCPAGGHYQLAADGKQVTCSAHGSPTAPTQPLAPPPGSVTRRLLQDFAGLTANLTFLEEGLHAVLIIDRK